MEEKASIQDLEEKKLEIEKKIKELSEKKKSEEDEKKLEEIRDHQLETFKKIYAYDETIENLLIDSFLKLVDEEKLKNMVDLEKSEVFFNYIKERIPEFQGLKKKIKPKKLNLWPEM